MEGNLFDLILAFYNDFYELLDVYLLLGSSAKKSISLEALVSQSANVNHDLKEKLKDIIKTGKDYDYDVSTSIKNLITSSDQEIVLLSTQAVSELVKSEDKIETYAHKDIIIPILQILGRDVYDQTELIKQCCRALGNLCCDCDTSRKIILENNGVLTLGTLLEKCLDLQLDEIKLLVCKTLLNFGIGGQEFCEAIMKEELPYLLHRILTTELSKEDFDDDTVSTSLLLLSVLNDNIPELLQSVDINKDVLKVLEKTTNTDISEMCLDHLNTQAEHGKLFCLTAIAAPWLHPIFTPL